MAKGHGGQSKYIEKHIKINVVAYVAPAILSVVGMFFIYVVLYRILNHNNPLTVIGIFAVFLLVLYVIKETVDYAFNTDTFLRGGDGEADIRDELDKLSDDYSYFRGVKINEKNHDADFVVVGPTGIFAIDAKSHNGSIEYNNGHLSKNNKPFKKNVISQAKSEALFVHNLIKEKFNTEIFVTPVIVFSSFWAKLYFGFKPVDNVYIVKRKWLRVLIEDRQQFRYPFDRRLIEQELQKICNP